MPTDCGRCWMYKRKENDMESRWCVNLGGKWELFPENGEKMEGELPGCTYLALIDNQRIGDPFWGKNEETAMKWAEQAYRYKRRFTLSREQLRKTAVELVVEGADTLAVIRINGNVAGKTENAFRTYRFSVKKYLTEGDNEIEIDFEPPHAYMRRLQEKRPLAGMNIGVPGISYIRKPQYHFGWDWGPCLPPAGISGKIALEGYSGARLSAFAATQRHEDGKAFLTIKASCEEPEKKEQMALIWSVAAPDGTCPDCEYPLRMT